MNEACRICGSSSVSRWKSGGLGRSLRPEDLRITDSRYGLTLPLYRCTSCGFVFAPTRDVAQLSALYEDLSDGGYERSQAARARQMRRLLGDALRERPDAASLLDIGAGTGLLVQEAVDRGLEARGVEPSRALVDFALAKNGVVIERGVYPHPGLVGMKFDLVFLVDVIEHVADPLELIRDCRGALAAGGMLVVVTPDVSSAAARLLGEKWWHYRPGHVSLFDRESMGRAAEAAGLHAVRWSRPRRYFSVGYLADRLERYLPIGWFNRFAKRFRPFSWLYGRVIPLNLFDSYLVFFIRE